MLELPTTGCIIEWQSRPPAARSPPARLPAHIPPTPRRQDQGNRALKTGLQHKKKFYLRQAIEQYTQGLGVGCLDVRLNSLLNSNRAQAGVGRAGGQAAVAAAP